MDWNLFGMILQKYWPLFVNGALTTLWISIIGTVAGLFIGLMIGIIRTIPKPGTKGKRIVLKIIHILLNLYIEIFRGTPMMVQAMVLYYGAPLFLGWEIPRMTSALIIISINTGAYMAEIVRGGILSVDKGQFEAAHAIGMSHFQTMVHIVMPQALRNILPATGNEFVINIKDSSVLNVISISELFFQAKTIGGMHFRVFEPFLIAGIIYFVLTFAVTRMLRRLEKKMDGSGEFIMAGNQMQV